MHGAEVGTKIARRHMFWRRDTGHVNAILDALLCTARHIDAKIYDAETG